MCVNLRPAHSWWLGEAALAARSCHQSQPAFRVSALASRAGSVSQEKLQMRRSLLVTKQHCCVMWFTSGTVMCAHQQQIHAFPQITHCCFYPGGYQVSLESSWPDWVPNNSKLPPGQFAVEKRLNSPFTNSVNLYFLHEIPTLGCPWCL